MAEVLLHGKRAVKVNAERIMFGSKAANGKTRLYNIDGDKTWVPDSLCEFNPCAEYKDFVSGKTKGPWQGDTPGELTIVEWFYNKIFPTG